MKQPQPTRTMTIRLSTEEREALRALASRTPLSKARLARHALALGLAAIARNPRLLVAPESEAA